jgi:hypothetical protein
VAAEPADPEADASEVAEEAVELPDFSDLALADLPLEPEEPSPAAAPKKVFIAHGKSRTPLEQVKKALDQFKVKYAVAVDEPNQGRPISKKVANLMRRHDPSRSDTRISGYGPAPFPKPHCDTERHGAASTVAAIKSGVPSRGREGSTPSPGTRLRS